MATATERYKDSHGVYWDEVRTLLPASVSQWERVRPVLKSEACAIMHDLYGFCFLCSTDRSYGFSGTLEAHHILGGSKKSDELCNLVILCRGCHAQVQSAPAELPRVLRAKWRHDRAHTDWRRLTLLNRSWWAFDSMD
jgi:5-methylcytosine-specific restriction endonuclease McrA